MNVFVKPKCILVGKTNVGKSTLFNRLSNRKISIAHETPGATRDCITRDTEFYGHHVTMVDSGGIDQSLEGPFQDMVSQRVADFISEQADLVIFVVSAKDGITIQDIEIAHMLRKLGKPVLAVVNKVDHENNNANALSCMRFGFNEPLMVSASQVSGLRELKERICQDLGLVTAVKESNHLQLISVDEESEESYDPSKVNLAVVGKPNSGKSTFVNAILNEDRVMTSDIPGTTVDAVDTFLTYAGKDICLIDTAGIRRQRSIYEEVEKMAVARALCAVDRADVAILMINAKEGVSEQDKKIAGIIFEKKKACVLAINQWDEDITKESSKDKFTDHLRFHLPFFAYAPVVFLSAKYGRDVFDVIDIALKLFPRFNRRINTSKLNRSLEKAQLAHPAPVVMGRRIKMFFATQIDTAPPTFAISCSKPAEIHFSYKRYLTNHFRTDLDLAEVPIRLVFRNKSDAEAFKHDQ